MMEKVFVFLIVVALAVALQPAAGGGLERRKSSTNDIFLDTTRGDESPRGRSKSKERPRSSSPSKGKRSRSRSKSRNRDVDIPIVSRTDTLIAPTRLTALRLHGDPDLWKETVAETIRTFRDLEEEGKVGTPETFYGFATLRPKFPQLITRVYQAKRGDCRIQQILNLPKSGYGNNRKETSGDDSKAVYRFQDRQPTEMKDCMSFLKETRHNIEHGDDMHTSPFSSALDDENEDNEVNDN